jgi:hypothetical protein
LDEWIAYGFSPCGFFSVTSEFGLLTEALTTASLDVAGVAASLLFPENQDDMDMVGSAWSNEWMMLV